MSPLTRIERAQTRAALNRLRRLVLTCGYCGRRFATSQRPRPRACPACPDCATLATLEERR